jgi:CMP-N-acetylneuraminic acid synthetase
MDDAGGLAPLFEPEKADMRSQDMPLGYIDAGQMYWFRTEYFFEHGTAIGRGTRLVELARESAIDLDTEDDWVFAEKLARLCLEKKFCVS